MTRVPADMKARLSALAKRRGVKKSALVRQLIAAALGESASVDDASVKIQSGQAQRRVASRLNAADRRALREHASARNVRISRYLSALVRAHLKNDVRPPANIPPRLLLRFAPRASGSAVSARLAASGKNAGIAICEPWCGGSAATDGVQLCATVRDSWLSVRVVIELGTIDAPRVKPSSDAWFVAPLNSACAQAVAHGDEFGDFMHYHCHGDANHSQKRERNHRPQYRER